MQKGGMGRTLASLGVMFGIILLLWMAVMLRDYDLRMNGFVTTFVARISIPRPNSIHISNSEPGKLTVTTSSKGSQVAGYEFRISRFQNMAFAHL